LAYQKNEYAAQARFIAVTLYSDVRGDCRKLQNKELCHLIYPYGQIGNSEASKRQMNNT